MKRTQKRLKLLAAAATVSVVGTMTFPAAANASSSTSLQLANDKPTWTRPTTR